MVLLVRLDVVHMLAGKIGTSHTVSVALRQQEEGEPLTGNTCRLKELRKKYYLGAEDTIDNESRQTLQFRTLS